MSDLFNEMMEEISEKDKKIADLEAKLIEKDKAIENWQTMYQSVMKSCHNGIEEDKRLREQLAEKEKEIERWHNNYKQRDRQFQSVRQRYHLLNRLQAKYHDKHKLHLSEMQCLELVEENEKLQQDKISFCIKQLEKVKEYNATRVYSSSLVDKFIDNQIEELKKEMK